MEDGKRSLGILLWVLELELGRKKRVNGDQGQITISQESIHVESKKSMTFKIQWKSSKR